MGIRTAARRGVFAVGASLLVAGGLAATPAAAAPPDIHPGIQTVTSSPGQDGGGQCTANFLFHDGGKVYLGQAAHCAGTGAATDTNGCDAGSLPLGSNVELGDTGLVGKLVYSSWLTMQAKGERDEDTCTYNDFALIDVTAYASRTSPQIPFWGGPTGVDTDGTEAGETVYSYGNSSLRFGVEQLSPKQGTSLGTTGGGWSHDVYTASPGIPGDSGSAFIDGDGKGIGILVTLQAAPLAGSNGVTDLDHAMDYYAKANGLPGLTLGTAAFTGGGGLLGVLGGLLG